MSEWREVALGDLITLQRGFDLTAKAATPGPYPVISSGGTSYTTDVAKVEGPGVVTGRKGVLGKVHFSVGPYWPHDTTLWVKNFKESDPRFIYYLLQTLPLASLDAGSSNPTLNRNHAHLLPVRVPDPASQQLISSLLGTIDDLIENDRRRIELLEEMARAIYREWFVRFRYPGHESGPLVDSPLGPIPEGWTVMAASEAVVINPRLKSSREHEGPFITMGDLPVKGMTVFPSEYRAGGSGAKFQNGDVLFARITPSLENGKTALVQGLGNGEIARGSTEFIVLRGRSVGSAFTYFLARSDDFRDHAIKSMAGASGRQRVRNECFDTFMLPIPPPSLADEFEALAQPLLTLIHELARQSETAERLRDVLLPKLVTGQIDVSDIDLDALISSVRG